MDRASQVLAQGVPFGVPKSYRALADQGGALEQKAKSQQYLTPWEESAFVKFLLQMSDFGQPIRIKFIPSLAFSVTHQRPLLDRPLKPPGRNWAKPLERRHSELQSRRVRALDWNRQEKTIYNKIIHWFAVIGEVLRDPSIVAENVYNTDETGVMLSMPGSVKVLVGKSDRRD